MASEAAPAAAARPVSAIGERDAVLGADVAFIRAPGFVYPLAALFA